MKRTAILSLLILLNVPAFLHAAATLVVPNPYKPNDGNPETGIPYDPANPRSGVLFTNLPAGSTVRIYNVRGRLLRRITVTSSGTLQWNVRDDNNNGLPSGVYNVLFTTPSDKFRKKLFIIK